MAERRDVPLLCWGDKQAAHAAARRRLRQRGIVLATIAGTTLICGPALVPPSPRLIWNASPSVPTGLYWLSPDSEVRRGSMVLAWLPPSPRSLAAERRYLPRSVPLLKPVAGVAGDRVCASGRVVTVDNRISVRRRIADRRGRPLPWWEGCLTLGRDQLFLLATAREDSFDSRYFGAVDRRNIIGTVRLLWAS